MVLAGSTTVGWTGCQVNVNFDEDVKAVTGDKTCQDTEAAKPAKTVSCTRLMKTFASYFGVQHTVDERNPAPVDRWFHY